MVHAGCQSPYNTTGAQCHVFCVEVNCRGFMGESGMFVPLLITTPNCPHSDVETVT